MNVVYMELSVGCTRYLFGAMRLSNSMSGFMLTTPDINIGGV